MYEEEGLEFYRQNLKPILKAGFKFRDGWRVRLMHKNSSERLQIPKLKTQIPNPKNSNFKSDTTLVFFPALDLRFEFWALEFEF